MNPYQKKDVAMTATTNIYMNATTKYTPVPIKSDQKTSPEKTKEAPFIYRPPAPKVSQDLSQNKDLNEIKRSSISNSRSSGIDVSRISELGTSSIFKGLDNIYTKPVLHSDRSISEKCENKETNGNAVGKNKTNIGHNRFERSHRNKLNDTPTTQNKTSPNNLALKTQQAKQQSTNQSSSQMIVRKPIGRTNQTEQKVKQVQKSPIITRKNQVQAKNSPAQQQSFTTQTSSFAYKPAIKRTSVANQVSSFNYEKKDEAKKEESNVQAPVQKNLYGRNRTRQSKEVQLNLEVNTEVAYFKIESKGGEQKRPSKEKSLSKSQTFKEEDKTTNIDNKASIYPGQKKQLTTQTQSPKNENVNQDKNIQKKVPYYLKPKIISESAKQTITELKSEVTQQRSNVKLSQAVQSTIQSQESIESNGYVYKPKSYQNPNNVTVTNTANQTKKEAENKNLNIQTEQKPTPFYGRKPREEVQSETTKNFGQTKPSLIKKVQTSQNKPIVQEIPKKENIQTPQKPYYGRQSNQQAINKVEEKTQEITQAVKPSFKYNPRQQQVVSKSPEVQNPKNIPQVQPEAPKYSYGRKSISSPQSPETLKSQIPQKTETNQNIKGNSSGYVYQPPSRKASTVSNELTPITSETKDKDEASQISKFSPLTNNKSQTNKSSEVKTNVAIQLSEPKIIQKSYPYKRNLQQQNQTKNDSETQVTVSNPVSQAKPIVQRPSYLQNAKQQSSLVSQNTNEKINQIERQETQDKKPIPQVAFNIFAILIKKKITSNFKHSFSQLFHESQRLIKKQKSLEFLAKKSTALSKNYEHHLKTEVFIILKKLFISDLTRTAKVSNSDQGSRVIQTKTVNKTKESQEEVLLSSLTTNLKKTLCYKLNSLFNSKISEIFKEKLVKSFDRQNFKAKKQPIFQAIFKIFSLKFKQHLTNSFQKLKFSYSYVSKRNDDDLLSLFDTRNKKFTKHQITKYFQSVYQTTNTTNSMYKSSLLEKTPEKQFSIKTQISKSPNLKNIEKETQKTESQKITNLRTKIDNLEKEANQQQKLTADKEKQINQRKVELKRQINTLKSENEKRKKENEDLKQKLKKYEAFNNFGDSKEEVVLGSEIQLESRQRKQNFENVQNIATSSSNEFLNILCSLYAENMLRSHSLNTNHTEPDQFFTQCLNSNPLIAEGLNFLMNPEDQCGFPMIQSDQELRTKLSRSRQLISQRILIEENLLLKAQISSIQAQLADESQSAATQDFPKVRQQVDTVKKLVKNYIKERYLWEWIRNSISKL